MKKRSEKILIVVLTGVCAMLLFGVNGKAYIDPSVTSYIIQAIAGIVIAVAAVVGIYFRKAKKKVNKIHQKKVKKIQIMLKDIRKALK